MDITQIPYTFENAEKIVNEFYATSQVTNEFKPQLDQWLKQAQNSQEAWVFGWELIDMNKSINCQFYGASCLYNKVSKHFGDVPPEQYDILKNKLLEKLLLYATTLLDNKHQQIRLIQRKLNSALAKLALYLIQDQWQNCIQDMITTIPNCINEPEKHEEQRNQLILIVIDLLTLLPEEYQTLSNLNKLKRTQINSQLKKNFPLIRDYLLNLFNSFNSLPPNMLLSTSSLYFNMIENSIKCLTSWIEFGIQMNDIQQFIDYLFVYIYNDSLFDQSAECLTSLFSSEDNLKYTNSIFKYMPKILELQNLLTKFIEEKDNDGSVVLTKLILAFGENQLSVIFDGFLSNNDQVKQILLQFINLIMNLTSMPGNFPVDEESSDLTFVFWYSLQDTLLGIDQGSNELLIIFRPFFINLLEIFILKLQLPNNYDDWTEEEKERLRCYRIDIGDTMVYMISLVGEVMLEFIVKRLVRCIEAEPDNWRIQEALIYMLQSVVSELNESCSPDFSYNNDIYLISFVDLIPKIKYSNKHILSTTLLAVGSLGSWLERNVNVLPNAISLCLLGLKTESVTQSASFALKDIINDCDLSSYAEQIIATSQEALKSCTVAQNYEIRLMSIIGMCLSDLLSVEYQRAINWLQNIVEPYIIKLTELSQLKQTDKNTQSATCHILNLLSQLMSSLIQRSQNHNSTDLMAANDSTASSVNTSFQIGMTPSGTGLNSSNDERVIVNSLLIKLIPIYKQIISRNLPNDLIVIDKLFESISVTLSSNLASNTPQPENEITEAILNELIQMFYILNENSWRRFAYEVCRQILIIWWKNDKYKSNLENLFHFSFQNAMKLMSKDMNWFHDHTDVVEQYCTCLAKLLKSKYYDLFEKFNQESLLYLLKFAQLGLQLPEQYTLRAVATFLEEFIKFTKIKNNLMEFLEHNSFNLIHVIIMGISGGLPRHLVDILSGILYTYVKEYPQLTNSILHQILIKNDFQPLLLVQQPNTSGEVQQNIPSQHLTKEQKQSFVKSVLSESNNKRKFKEAITEFSLTCRGLWNQYGKETSSKY
ncbi:unnamed protein product [Brachionus calyciflorus]|uniref:Importin-13 n=1 Tax=Brachionus calyciflorus TaxID=104777 RepID=A0A813T1N4_9BILA|nr:unnamed protein product [Brachionus calyciflorus]